LDVDEQVVQVLEASLNVKLDRRRISANTALLDILPDFESMAVVAVLTTMEERFGFTVDDDEVDGSVFETIGSLAAFLRGKLGA
jgi:acyl carrier protein